ncbi:hypothetical protein GP2_026_00920 [Gordonia paraffinivorans NBRC 108238]|uniref:Uncharacterized protein n=1 Tax=Gordonia paraffinivorans NBRC 108238 TaxID=1223543 RepID=A0ABQ0IMR3_9ACTN|nr:hypothetical protein [Gordonia paraffinivorans]GAC84855.1 hypothetical protein GP2_026_00920 [Gordonia paraffinivorans NBRC 108238]
MTLASAWLAFGDKAAVGGDISLSRWPSTPWIIVGTLGVIFFGATALIGIAVLLFNPSHRTLPEELEPILRARWQPDSWTEGDSA